MQGPGAGGPGGGARRGPGGQVGVLNVLAGNDRGKQYPLVNPQTQIGRGADQDLILADIAVSRRHVIILIEGERYRLKDLGSGNGTLLNGVRTATAILNDGDQIEIGNTLLRFDHPPSARVAPAPAPMPIAPVPQAGPQQRTVMADAPMQYQQPPPPQQQWQPPPPQQQWQPPPQASPYGTMQVETPSEPVAMPPMQRGPSTAMPQVTGPQAQRPAGGGGLLDTPVKKAAVFGTLAVVVLLGGAVVAKVALGGGGKADAQKLFLDGKSAFAAGDYDKAKKLFGDALVKDPSLAEATKYARQCDVEIFAHDKIAQAQKLAASKKWDEELKVLERISTESAAYDEAMKLKKAAIPEAVKSLLEEAKGLMGSDAEGAKGKVEAALELDADNTEAQELMAKLKGGGTEVAAAPAPEKPAKGGRGHAPAPPPPAKVKVAAAPPPPAKTPAKKPSDDDDDDDDGPAAGGGGDVLSSKAAGPYRAKDFVGAAAALKGAAKTAKGPAAQKMNTLAAQVARLADLYQKAEADKARNPVQAVQEYQQAMTIDASVAKGMHGAFFKSQAGKLAQDAARVAFQQQRFDTAFEMSKTAIRLAGNDGGVQAQLKQKATALNSQAQAKARTDPNGAKALWRLVLRMVPPGDPAYLQAQKGLQSAQGPSDQDED